MSANLKPFIARLAAGETMTADQAEAAFDIIMSGEATPAQIGALLMALVAVAGICVSAWHGVAYTELATLAGTARAGTALGMANTAVYAGLFITPLASPHVLAAGSWGTVWLVAGLSALCAFPLFPKPQRP